MKVRIHSLFFPLLLLQAGGKLTAQNEFYIYAPAKDVALLVDVSVSVKGDVDGHKDAKRIIQDIVGGQGYSAARLSRKWELETPTAAMTELFGAYLGLPASPGAAEKKPLIGSGQNFLSMRMGTVATVLAGGSKVTLKTGTDERAVIEGLIEKGYPAISDINDKSTCFWFAMARAASTLSQNTLGYYLFVVSDEEDDPDYRKDGPPLHTAADYKNYINGLAKTYPETVIRAEIARYFDHAGVNVRNVDVYRPRGDFKQVPIARFTQSGRSSKKVSLSWYAMRVEPQRIEVPKVIIPDPVQPLVQGPVKYQPPDFSQSMRVQLLGGLKAAQPKSFNYSKPLIVWQVVNGEAASTDLLGVEMDGKKAKTSTGASQRVDKQTLQLTDASAKEGKHEFRLAYEKTGSADISTSPEAPADEAEIILSYPSNLWLNILAIVSSLAAIIIFILAWRSLRETQRPKAVAR
jgi:hypothetical protein